MEIINEFCTENGWNYRETNVKCPPYKGNHYDIDSLNVRAIVFTKDSLYEDHVPEWSDIDYYINFGEDYYYDYPETQSKEILVIMPYNIYDDHTKKFIKKYQLYLFANKMYVSYGFSSADNFIKHVISEMRNLFNPRTRCYSCYESGRRRCKCDDLGYDTKIRMGDIIPYVEMLENRDESIYDIAEIVKCRYCNKNTVKVKSKSFWCRVCNNRY